MQGKNRTTTVRLDSSITGPESIPIVTSSYQLVSQRIQQVRDLFVARRVKFHRDSALAKMFRTADKLVKAVSEGNRTAPIKDVLAIAHANSIAEAILEVQFDAQAQLCLKRIAGDDMDLSQRNQSMGKDYFWELACLQLLRKHHFAATLNEPDIVMDLDGLSYPVACKKIYSENGVGAQLKKGCEQLKKHGFGGLIAVNIDDLLPANFWLSNQNHEEAFRSLSDFNQQFIENHRAALRRYVAPGRADGVLVVTSGLATKGTPTSQTMTTISNIWPENNPHADSRGGFARLLSKLKPAS